MSELPPPNPNQDGLVYVSPEDMPVQTTPEVEGAHTVSELGSTALGGVQISAEQLQLPSVRYVYKQHDKSDRTRTGDWSRVVLEPASPLRVSEIVTSMKNAGKEKSDHEGAVSAHPAHTAGFDEEGVELHPDDSEATDAPTEPGVAVRNQGAFPRLNNLLDRRKARRLINKEANRRSQGLNRLENVWGSEIGTPEYRKKDSPGRTGKGVPAYRIPLKLAETSAHLRAKRMRKTTDKVFTAEPVPSTPEPTAQYEEVLAKLSPVAKDPAEVSFASLSQLSRDLAQLSDEELTILEKHLPVAEKPRFLTAISMIRPDEEWEPEIYSRSDEEDDGYIEDDYDTEAADEEMDVDHHGRAPGRRDYVPAGERFDLDAQYPQYLSKKTLDDLDDLIYEAIREEAHSRKDARGVAKLPRPEFLALSKEIREEFYDFFFDDDTPSVVEAEVRARLRNRRIQREAATTGPTPGSTDSSYDDLLKRFPNA